MTKTRPNQRFHKTQSSNWGRELSSNDTTSLSLNDFWPKCDHFKIFLDTSCNYSTVVVVVFPQIQTVQQTRPWLVNSLSAVVQLVAVCRWIISEWGTVMLPSPTTTKNRNRNNALLIFTIRYFKWLYNHIWRICWQLRFVLVSKPRRSSSVDFVQVVFSRAPNS